MADGQDEEEQMFEERIELTPRERISQLIEGAKLKPALEEFFDTKLTPDNMRVFKASIDQSYFHTTMTLNERLNEIFKVLAVHPEFNRYFKAVMEKKEEKKKRRPVEQIYDLTETDHIEIESRLIELLSYFIPRSMLIIEILKSAVDKYDSYIFSPVPSMVKAVDGAMPTPSYGRGRCERAWELHSEGKTNKEIADVLGVGSNQAGRYWKYWEERLGAKSKKKEGDIMAGESDEEPKEKPEETKEEEEQLEPAATVDSA